MARRGLNKPIVAKGVQIVGGLQTNAGVGGSSMTTPGESNGTLGELVHVYNTISADWVGTRYFAVDYDGGSDEAIGFSDVSMADSGTKALKTIEELLTRVPRLGNGQIVVIAIKNRAAGATYLKKDGVTADSIILNGFYGYSLLLVRATGTVATASATAFANDTADKIALGAQIVAGTNAAGYSPTTFAVDTFTVTPGGLAAEPALIGKRIRFNSTTTTVALRNATAMIHANTANTITVADDLPAVPVGTDVFYIEEPSTAVLLLDVASNCPNPAVISSLATEGIQIAGIRTVGTGTNRNAIYGVTLCQLSFIDSANEQFTSVSVLDYFDCRFVRTYVDESGTSIITGVGIRSIGGINSSRGNQILITSSALVSVGGTQVGRFQGLNISSISAGAGCYFFSGVLIQGSACGTSAVGTPTTNLIGRGSVSTARRLRILESIAVPITGLNISMADCHIWGVDITGQGANSMMILRAVGTALSIDDVVGSTGNTDGGLDLTFAKDCHITMGTIAANTYTGSAGQDIVGSGRVLYVHADYARCDLRDDAGNHIQGTAGSIIGPTIIVANDGNASLGQYKIVRPTASGAVRASIATAASTAIAVGVTQSASSTTQNTMIVNGGGTWIQFDAAPSPGDIAYLSTTTAGNAQNTAPVLSGTNQILRIGRVLRVSGTLGYVNFEPDISSSLANGSSAINSFFNTEDIAASQTIVNGITYLVDTSGGAINLTLPAASRNAYFLVKDKTGNSGTNNVTIVRAAAEKIENVAANKILSTPFFMATFVSNGTDWFMV